MQTFDQIEEIRRGERPSLSLQQAYDNLVRLGRASGIVFKRCEVCKGNGWTTATLLSSIQAIHALAQACPNEPVPIQYDRCLCCYGSGGWIEEL